jgi:hypothetical protein
MDPEKGQAYPLPVGSLGDPLGDKCAYIDRGPAMQHAELPSSPLQRDKETKVQ